MAALSPKGNVQIRHKLTLSNNKMGKTSIIRSQQVEQKPLPAAPVAPVSQPGIQNPEPPPPTKAPATPGYQIVNSYTAQYPQHAQQQHAQTAPQYVAPEVQAISAPASLPQSGLQISAAPVKTSGFAGKTGILDKGKIVTPGKPVDLQKDFSSSVDTILDQMQIYVEICDNLSDRNWIPQNLIDMLLLLTRSFNFDAVSLVLAETAQPSKLAQPVSRGYRTTPPPADVVEIWGKSLDGRTKLDWEQLMKTVVDNHSPLASWILSEGITSFSYIPIFDLNHIYGFVFIGSYSRHKLTPMSTMILDLCGGRIGLSLAARGSSGTWPETVLNGIAELRDQFSLIMGYFEMANESGGLPPDEIKSLFAKCFATVAESVQLVDRLSKQAINPSSE